MKFTTLVASATVVATAMLSGCKYDQAAEADGATDAAAAAGAGADGAYVNGGVSDIAAEQEAYPAALDEAAALRNQTEGTLDNVGERRFEDYCARCTDVSFNPVYFGFDSTVIPQTELGKIDAVAQHLQGNPARVLVIEGHCDERGSNEYNLSLGESRAIMVRNYLLQAGVAPNRIQTRSFGEERPAVEGFDENAWAANRRAEFAVYQQP